MAAIAGLSALGVLALVTLPATAITVLPPAILLHRRGVQLTRLHRAATTDSAIGLLNAYGWHQQADVMAFMTSQHRTGLGNAVLIIDFDHFKSINDSYGHQAGDAVLAAVADAVRASVRARDAAGRLGGDEFAVFLSAVTATELAGVAERIRSTIAALRVDIGGADPTTITGLSVSIGAAICPDGCPTTVEQLAAAADTALYAAKRNGRNRVSYSAGPAGAAEHDRTGLDRPELSLVQVERLGADGGAERS